MEHAPHWPTAAASIPVEKQLERTRAGEQLTAYVRAVLDDSRARHVGPDTATADVELDAELDAEVLRREVPLLRAAAKYLLTACDRLRRGAVREAWTYRTSNPELAKGAIADAKLWDKIMRELSSQLGVLHPLNELVTPLPIGEGELSELGLPYSQLLNGEDLLAL